jgi:hypothetical protein
VNLSIKLSEEFQMTPFTLVNTLLILALATSGIRVGLFFVHGRNAPDWAVALVCTGCVFLMYGSYVVIAFILERSEIRKGLAPARMDWSFESIRSLIRIDRKKKDAKDPNKQ